MLTTRAFGVQKPWWPAYHQCVNGPARNAIETGVAGAGEGRPGPAHIAGSLEALGPVTGAPVVFRVIELEGHLHRVRALHRVVDGRRHRYFRFVGKDVRENRSAVLFHLTLGQRDDSGPHPHARGDVAMSRSVGDALGRLLR